MSQTVESVETEVASRHRATARIVVAVFILTLVLMVLAQTGVLPARPNRNPIVEGTLRIVIVLFGLGAVAMRRTRFSPIRLRDIAALRGVEGLLDTLQKTTVYVALLGGAIAIMGFVIALMSGDGKDMLWLGIIAIAVLFYAYPRRAAWQRVVEST